MAKARVRVSVGAHLADLGHRVLVGAVGDTGRYGEIQGDIGKYTEI